MIRSEPADGYRVVTLDRPASRNALTPAGLDELEAAIAEANEPIVYLHGAGPAFCAGADLDVVADLDDPAAFAAHGQRVADAIEAADPIVIAGIDGPVRGGGVELALACDIRVATPDATFAEPGVRFGLFGAWGGTIRLPQLLREGDAMDLALSGRTIDAEEALRIGLVSRIVDDPETVAVELCANKPDALAVVAARIADRRDASAQAAAEAAAFDRLVRRYAPEIAADRDR
ncbi:MAG: enoyl-CoA hydratase/isomerase family protein [Halobacteriota archaeon]